MYIRHHKVVRRFLIPFNFFQWTPDNTLRHKMSLRPMRLMCLFWILCVVWGSYNSSGDCLTARIQRAVGKGLTSFSSKEKLNARRRAHHLARANYIITKFPSKHITVKKHIAT